MKFIDGDRLQKLVVKAVTGTVIGIGGSAVLKLGSKIAVDSINEIVNGVRESAEAK